MASVVSLSPSLPCIILPIPSSLSHCFKAICKQRIGNWRVRLRAVHWKHAKFTMYLPHLPPWHLSLQTLQAFAKSKSRTFMYVTFCLDWGGDWCVMWGLRGVHAQVYSSVHVHPCLLPLPSSWWSSYKLITGVWSLYWLLAWPLRGSLWVTDPYCTGCFHLPQYYFKPLSLSQWDGEMPAWTH